MRKITRWVITFVKRILKCKEMDLQLFEDCDNILRVALSYWRKGSGISYGMEQDRYVLSLNGVEAKDHDVCMRILINDEFIMLNGQNGFGHFHITDKGIHFINTDSYVERAKRTELDKKTKKWTYRYRGVAWIISTLALIVSMRACWNSSHVKNTTMRILLLPEKETKKGAPIPARLHPEDTLDEKNISKQTITQ